MSFTDFYKKDMLGEGAVPFSKYDLIKQKMSEHYAVPDGTFGIEFEYLPRSKDEYSLEDIVEALSKNYNNKIGRAHV